MRPVPVTLLITLLLNAPMAFAQPVRLGDTVRLGRLDADADSRFRLGQVTAISPAGAVVDLFPLRGARGGPREVSWSGLDICVDRHREVGKGLAYGLIGGAITGFVANQVYRMTSPDWNMQAGDAAALGAAVGGYFGIRWGFNRKIGYWAPVEPRPELTVAPRRYKCGHPAPEFSFEKEWEWSKDDF